MGCVCVQGTTLTRVVVCERFHGVQRLLTLLAVCCRRGDGGEVHLMVYQQRSRNGWEGKRREGEEEEEELCSEGQEMEAFVGC